MTTDVTPRPLYRPFAAIVGSVDRLSECFVRVTLVGDDLADFAAEGLDQRFKLMLPNVDGEYPPLDGEGWYAAWCALDDAVRPPLRTYTVRRIFRYEGSVRIEVDFVLHGSGDGSGEHGPASRWVQALEPGDRAVIVGPDALSGGPFGSVAWNPPLSARRYILAGDETAAPAIASILESLDHHTQAIAYIEVPTESDVPDIDLRPGTRLRWLPRNGRPHGELLSAALIAELPAASASEAPAPDPDDSTDDIWEVPGLDPLTGAAVAPASAAEHYVWLAGESSVIKSLRRHLVNDVGLDRSAVAFMGYWRAGFAG